MRAAVLKEFGKPLSVEEVAKPTPGEEEVLVKVMACGVDGTDLKLMEGFGYRPDLPTPVKPRWSSIPETIPSDLGAQR